MEALRKPFQGVWNIIRFNWQYYLLSIMAIVGLIVTGQSLPTTMRALAMFLVLIIIIANLISLAVSFFIYDHSSLYRLTWLNSLQIRTGSRILNINAGFDETSTLLKHKFANAELTVLDFYDHTKHTEVSIRRARKAYPPFPNTIVTSTSHLPLSNNYADVVFALLSAHEIRNDQERISFFKELNRVLTATGRIIVTEHLRDTSNFLAYNIGFFHFHSKGSWLKTFKSAGFRVAEELKITPFITTFILDKNGTAS